jgi:hypothetical protein
VTYQAPAAEIKSAMHDPRPVVLLTPVRVALLCGLVLSLGSCDSPEVGASGDVAAVSASPSGGGAEKEAADSAKGTNRPPLRPGAKTVALERAGNRPYDKTFDDIRFDIQPGQPFHREMLPDAIEALAGQRIRIRGYILPTAQKRGIKTFVLVRDNQECCFGPGAALYDCILVEMKPGKTAEYTIRPVAVEGTFGLEEVKSGDMHLAIYRLDADLVR